MRNSSLAGLALGALAMPICLGAQAPKQRPILPDAAYITKAEAGGPAQIAAHAAAITLALAQVPGGEIQIMELEREKGRLIYTFDLVVPGKKGHHEVDIDAMTGRAVRVVQEP